MSRPRRRPNRGRQQGGDARQARTSGKGRQARQGGRTRASTESFWGDPTAPATTADTVDRVRPTADPAALPRSLGEPPLTPDTAAPHHLAVVYEEAVRAATALAAANGLLHDPEVETGATGAPGEQGEPDDQPG
jgi:hypothetical protein